MISSYEVLHCTLHILQDSLLPHVEDGTIVLIGATTENPSFQVISALLSRCRVIVLEKLTVENIEVIVTRALDVLGAQLIASEDDIHVDIDCDHGERYSAVKIV